MYRAKNEEDPERNSEEHPCVLSRSLVSDCDPMDCSPPGSSVHGDSPGKNTGVGCHGPLQGIFPTQGSNPGLPHFRQNLCSLSHQGSPRTLEWVAYLFSRGSSRARNQMGVSCIAGVFTNWATREAPREEEGGGPNFQELHSVPSSTSNSWQEDERGTLILKDKSRDHSVTCSF